MKNAFLVAAMVSMMACSSSEEKADKQRECDQIAESIRQGAAARGIPSQGACNNPNPVAADLQSACAQLRQCNAEVDEL